MNKAILISMSKIEISGSKLLNPYDLCNYLHLMFLNAIKLVIIFGDVNHTDILFHFPSLSKKKQKKKQI